MGSEARENASQKTRPTSYRQGSNNWCPMHARSDRCTRHLSPRAAATDQQGSGHSAIRERSAEAAGAVEEVITPPDELTDYVDRLVKLIGEPCEVWWIGSGAAGKPNPKDLDLLVKGCALGTCERLASQSPLEKGSRFDLLVEIGPHEYRAPWPTDDRGPKHLGADELWNWIEISPTYAEYTGEHGRRCPAIRLHPPEIDVSARPEPDRL